MKTVRRLIYREILSAVVFVALAFLSLFFFIDFVDELPNVGKGGIASYRLTQALLYVALLAAQPPLRVAADRGADRHHLRDGAAGAEFGVHDPAHRRPRAGARLAPLLVLGLVFAR